MKTAMHTCVCKQCGVYFEYKRRRVFCSSECRANYDKRFRQEVSCYICGTVVVKTPGQLKDKKHTVCSSSCRNRLVSHCLTGIPKSEETVRRQNLAKTKEAILKSGEYHCHQCNKPFDNNLSLRAHSSWCSKPKTPCACDKCGTTFDNETSLRIHTSMWCDPDKKAAIGKKISASVYSSEKRRVAQCVSKPEAAFATALEDILGVVVDRSKVLPGIAHVYDMFVPSLNLVIEFDGDYWHGNPCKYPEPTKQQLEKQRKDRYASRKAREAGYTVNRVWQSESTTYLHELKEASSYGAETIKDFVSQKKWSNHTGLRHPDEDTP